MNMKIVTIGIVLVVLGAGYAAARPWNGGLRNGMMGGYGAYGNGMMYGPANEYGRGMMGMMGGYGNGFWNNMMGTYGAIKGYSDVFWGGMMGNQGGMMDGYGNGHCGGYGIDPDPGTAPLIIEEAGAAAEQYIASTGDADLKLKEVMEFSNHYYAEIEEKSTGTGAFELLINKYTGAVYPEPGPNMMWNTKYGHMGPWDQVKATVTEEQALRLAQEYLDRALPGTRAGDADAFHGYYTIHVLKDGKIYGMLSVNSYSGAVWYHNWHGEFIQMLE